MTIDADPISETTEPINAHLSKLNPSDQITFASILSQTVPCTSTTNTLPQQPLYQPTQDLELLELTELNKSFQAISLTEEDKARIYKPWAFSLIIKLPDKRVNHDYLRRKLTSPWKLSEALNSH